ncbi:MAG: PDZ domain-containing protein [Blastocatellia bacterium]
MVCTAALVVTSVGSGQTADRAGLKEGDLITQVAGMPVRGVQTLRAAVQTEEPGTRLSLVYLRRNPDSNAFEERTALAVLGQTREK